VESREIKLNQSEIGEEGLLRRVIPCASGAWLLGLVGLVVGGWLVVGWCRLTSPQIFLKKLPFFWKNLEIVYRHTS
jgi:hypothetical protein